MKEAFLIEGIGVEQALEKLRRGRVGVLAARRTQKNALVITVLKKDSKKVFAILRGSCYNVKKVCPLGLWRCFKACRRRSGLILGAVLFFALVLFFEGRILRIEVVGSGAYSKSEVLAILQEGGVTPLSPAPGKTALLTSRILSLPRVSFASLTFEGGTLTVQVEVSDEEAVFTPTPLRAERAGTLLELVVLRGTPAAEVGQEVKAGDVLISERVFYGEWEEKVLVVGYAVLLCPVEAFFAGTREGALEAAHLTFGADADLSAEPVEGGWRIFGQARFTFSSHMQ